MCTCKRTSTLLYLVTWWTVTIHVVAVFTSTEPTSAPQGSLINCEADNHVMSNKETLYVGENNQSMVVLCYSSMRPELEHGSSKGNYLYQGVYNRTLVGVRIDQMPNNGVIRLNSIIDGYSGEPFIFHVRFAAGVPTMTIGNERPDEDNFVCHHQGHRLLNNALVNVTEPTYIQCSAPYSGFDFIGRSDISPAKLPVLQPSPRDVAYHRLLIPLKCNCRDDTETMVLSGLRHGKNNSFPPFEFHVKWDCCPDAHPYTAATTSSFTTVGVMSETTTLSAVPTSASKAKELGVKLGIPIGILFIVILVIIAAVAVTIKVAMSFKTNINDEEKGLDTSTKSEQK